MWTKVSVNAFNPSVILRVQPDIQSMSAAAKAICTPEFTATPNHTHDLNISVSSMFSRKTEQSHFVAICSSTRRFRQPRQQSLYLLGNRLKSPYLALMWHP